MTAACRWIRRRAATGLRILAACATLGAVPARAAEGEAILLVYVEGAGAPKPLAARVDERLRALLSERGFTVTGPPAPTAPPVPPLDDARRGLARGIDLYRTLSLDAAVRALLEADALAVSSPDPEAASIARQARLYLGIVALATGDVDGARARFRQSAVLDPGRRLETRSFSPEVVDAYEQARRAVLGGPVGELRVVVTPGAQVHIDGSAARSLPAVLPYGEHLVQATTESGDAVERVELDGATRTVELAMTANPAKALASLRAAVQRGDPAGSNAAGDALARQAGTPRWLAWDLRQTRGRIEALVKTRSIRPRGPSRATIVDLGASASIDAPLRRAVERLFAPRVASRSTPENDETAIPAGRPAAKSGGSPRLGRWIWWAAGGVAVVAAGTAAIASAPPPDDRVSVTVEH